jgi:dTDP-glucose pyrophosphorylase
MNNKILVNENISLFKAIQRLNITGSKCLVVVDKKKILLGTLSNGDVRRSLFKGKKLKDSIKKIYNKRSVYYKDSNLDLISIKKIMINKKIDIIPIVNKDGKVINIINPQNIDKKSNSFKKTLNKVGVLIMAGGLGKRMKPFTDVLPKPLLPVKNKTAIDHIIQNFINIGFKEVNISINYKSKILKAYFEENKHNIKINFIEETTPLGTAGCIKLINKKYTDLLVVNCDIITNFDLANPILFHKNNNNLLTIFCSSKEFKIPYGICEVDKKYNFINLKEKPKLNFFINIGIYIFKTSLIDIVPKNKFNFDFDYFIQLAKDKNKNISLYPVNEDSWFDVGRWSEYKNLLNNI